MTFIVVCILVISFVASLIRSTLGFGESLIAVPLFLLFLPANIAVPLSVMLSVVIALVVIIQDHKKIHFHSAKWLIIYALFGLPIGILILIYGSEVITKTTIGLLIILYALYSLFSKSHKTLQTDSKLWLIVCGFISGVFGGAYGLNGPPIVVYGNLRRWEPKQFRATLQAYFLPVSLLTVFGYASKGLVTAEVGGYFLIALITTVPAIFLGRYLNHRLKGNSFYTYVYWGLAVLGVVLILGTLW